MPKRIRLYDYLEKELGSAEDLFEEVFESEGDAFTEETVDELISRTYDSMDRLSILTEGTDWPGIRRAALEAGLGLWMIARYARVTDEETRKHGGTKK
jgi:hypothetical protein